MAAEDPRADVELRVSGIVLRGDEILLMRHVRENKAYWVSPGGHPHPMEADPSLLERG